MKKLGKRTNLAKETVEAYHALCWYSCRCFGAGSQVTAYYTGKVSAGFDDAVRGVY